MTILQELHSNTGNVRVNTLEQVVEAIPEMGTLPNLVGPQPVIKIRLRHSRNTYNIGNFVIEEARDAAFNYLYENRNSTTVILPLERFFMPELYDATSVQFFLKDYSIQRYFANLFEKHFRQASIIDLMKLDCFSQLSPQDFFALKNGKYVESVRDFSTLWAKTLPVYRSVLDSGITKLQFFKTILLKHEQNHYIPFRRNYFPNGMRTAADSPQADRISSGRYDTDENRLEPPTFIF